MIQSTGTDKKQGSMGSSSGGSGSIFARVDGYMALETLGRALVYGPCVGLMFTSFWSVGLSLSLVLAPMAWLGTDGKLPSWMLATPCKSADQID